MAHADKNSSGDRGTLGWVPTRLSHRWGWLTCRLDKRLHQLPCKGSAALFCSRISKSSSFRVGRRPGALTPVLGFGGRNCLGISEVLGSQGAGGWGGNIHSMETEKPMAMESFPLLGVGSATTHSGCCRDRRMLARYGLLEGSSSGLPASLSSLV